MIGRPKGTCDSKLRTRGWTGEQIQLLVEIYYQETDAILSHKIGKSVAQIRKKARELGLGPKILPPKKDRH